MSKPGLLDVKMGYLHFRNNSQKQNGTFKIPNGILKW